LGFNTLKGEAMKLSEKTKSYLKMIGKTSDASLILTKGYAKQASELKINELAVFIPISTGGSHVALTTEGITLYEELFPIREKGTTIEDVQRCFAQHGCMGYWKGEYSTLKLPLLIALMVSINNPVLAQTINDLKKLEK
jgi:hypothetical protein